MLERDTARTCAGCVRVASDPGGLPQVFSSGTVSDTTIGGATFSVAHRTGAAVGNRYDETVYALPGTSPCVAVRYFVHWTIIENYPPGAVTAFDRPALVGTFDAMGGTPVLAP